MLLWELGSSKPATSHMALQLLHTALRFAPVGSALSSVLDGMQPQLCPFYCCLLATKASKGGSKATREGTKAGKMMMPGPLAQLPSVSQVMAHSHVRAQWFVQWCHGMLLETCEGRDWGQVLTCSLHHFWLHGVRT